MKIQILFFGITRDLASVSKDTFEIEDTLSITLKEFKKEIQKKYPNLKKEMDIFSFALNEGYISDDNQIINNNDVIAIIPPVSGG